MSDEKRGDAVADQWRERFSKRRRETDGRRRETDLALIELDVRADRKSRGDAEISEVIEQEAIERQRRKDSDPPNGKAKAAATILRLLPEGWGRVLVVLAAIAAATYLAGKGLKLF